MVNSVYINDNYDIYSDNTLQPIGPQSTSIFTFNNKEAIILGAGLNHKFKKINLGFMINQHIPIKINHLDTSEENSNSDTSDGEDSSGSVDIENTKNKKYGGGSIKIILSINI